MVINCGVLSGGKSIRMGDNKAFLKWKDSLMILAIIEELNKSHDIIVSVDETKKYGALNYELVEDENKNIGPIEGIRKILEVSKVEYNFICATDMPFLKKEIVEYLIEFISSDYDCYAISEGEKIHPLCAIYSKNKLKIINEMIEKKEYRLTKLLKSAKTKYIDINKSCYSKNILRNINTKEEYYKYLKKPIIFCISGVKNSGKTTMILGLIKEFKNLNKSVGVIKHDGHDFIIDGNDTDTNKFSKAFANKVAIFSSKKNAVIHHKDGTMIEEMIEALSDMEIIIIEGMKDSHYPKIEMIRSEISKRLVCDKRTLLGIATDIESINIDKDIKKFNMEDYKEIALHVIHRFNL